jgi:hypothetical protein
VPACNTFCPVTYVGFDHVTGLYYYYGWDCTVNPPQWTYRGDSRLHQVGGNCNDCVDCF